MSRTGADKIHLDHVVYEGYAPHKVPVIVEVYTDNPDLAEGSLAKLRASVVSTRALAGVARTLGLGQWMRLGKGEDVTGGRDKASMGS